ncbi:uncharacterized protein (TIGR02301 family) [Caulobacter ginsengisoli]|uniref:Uncharacterized protein (TIGR02301 family) n=1 Tax=Caulobacter ginsengisoli TaxID=400775 RepID=A0ABU0IXF8_9CAUL|nr:TIGR02301 family protein [Caulobacter ginsengisoli]MDQ0466692.1 uncharacterized protein (TIGR02301 family) [Caulobacter ginsengisoli]
MTRSVRAGLVIPLVIAGLLAGGPLFTGTALAQERSPVERQTLVDLAYMLGRSHALRQVCAGAGDYYWREKMMALSATEAPEADFDSRLKNAFNAGFASGQTEFPTCTADSRRAEAAAAQKGQGLAAQLASISHPVKRLGSDDPNAQPPADPDADTPAPK